MNELTTSLWITALGMGLVFGSIILLSVMMSLLTRFTVKKDSSLSATESDSPEPAPVIEEDHKAQAAAIAVAVAIAEQRSTQPPAEPPTALVSAWQLGMRTRQMYEKGGR